jgi:hypothetical protein
MSYEIYVLFVIIKEQISQCVLHSFRVYYISRVIVLVSCWQLLPFRLWHLCWNLLKYRFGLIFEY